MQDAGIQPIIDDQTGLPRLFDVGDKNKCRMAQDSANQTILPDTGITGNFAKLLAVARRYRPDRDNPRI